MRQGSKRREKILSTCEQLLLPTIFQRFEDIKFRPDQDFSEISHMSSTTTTHGKCLSCLRKTIPYRFFVV